MYKIFVAGSMCMFMLFISASASFAADNAMTAGDLQDICLGSNAESKAACKFYILGVTQGINLGMGFADKNPKSGHLCIPESISGSILELAVKSKMGQDLMVFPDDRKLDASGLVGAILIKTFPCRKKN